MTVDHDRGQVYAAELAAFDGTDMESVIGIDAVRRAIERVLDDPWWPGGTVTVRRMRSDARSSVTRCEVGDGAEGNVDIGITETQATLATAAHELAHALAGVERSHDATFRTAMLDVVQVITNADRLTGRGHVHVNQLRHAFDAAGLIIGVRDWPAPPAAGGAIAL